MAVTMIVLEAVSIVLFIEYPSPIVFSPIIGLVMAIIIIKVPIKKYNKRLQIYYLATEDHDGYIKHVKKSIGPMIIEETNRLKHTPKCPICGSKENVKKLTEIDRGVGMFFFGLADSSIGKQWTCTACQHDFNVEAVIEQSDNTQNIEDASNSVSELRKYKELLDDGLITQEDYENKKKQLLKL